MFYFFNKKRLPVTLIGFSLLFFMSAVAAVAPIKPCVGDIVNLSDQKVRVSLSAIIGSISLHLRGNNGATCSQSAGSIYCDIPPVPTCGKNGACGFKYNFTPSFTTKPYRMIGKLQVQAIGKSAKTTLSGSFTFACGLNTLTLASDICIPGAVCAKSGVGGTNNIIIINNK